MSDYQLNRAHDAARRQMEGSMTSEEARGICEAAIRAIENSPTLRITGMATPQMKQEDAAAIRQLLDENERQRDDLNDTRLFMQSREKFVVELSAKVAELEAALAAKDDQLQQAGNLLAIIHHDGGHYIAEHGWDKACLDAITEVTACRELLDRCCDAPLKLEIAEQKLAEAARQLEQAQAACAAYRKFISTEMTWLDFRDDMLKETASGKNARKLEAWLEKHGMTRPADPR